MKLQFMPTHIVNLHTCQVPLYHLLAYSSNTSTRTETRLEGRLPILLAYRQPVWHAMVLILNLCRQPRLVLNLNEAGRTFPVSFFISSTCEGRQLLILSLNEAGRPACATCLLILDLCVAQAADPQPE